MEVGHDAHRYGFEVSSATRLRTDPDPLSLYDLPGAPHKESLDFKRVESSDPYHSDGEVSSTGETDTSHGTVPSPFADARNPRAVGVDEDLTHEVGAEVFDLSDFGSIPKFIEDRIDNGFEVASFLVTNLATVMQQFKQWKAELPMVEPFYAVKCNPDPAIVRLLAHLGCSFDCATMGEIDMVVNGLGEDLSFAARGKVSRSLVYANPAKMPHMLEFAIKSGVRMTVFDGEDELHKIAAIPGHESLQLLLRLTTDDKASICRFSKKFGCPVAEATYMLKVAKDLGLNIAGVSFHVGSGCGDPAAYTTAIEHAAMVFEEGRCLGFQDMHIVDIGGGFPGDTSGYGGANMPTFQDLAAAIREAIAHFSTRLPDLPENMRFIAEPGRYFVSASTTVATKVYSRKGGHNNYQALYVDDGVYGTFNNVIYDHATPAPQRLQTVLHGKQDKVELLPTAVFGPTCDGIDQMCSLESTQLPRCEVGDWLIWENMGAYTHTASFVFNGYTHIPKKTYVYL